MDGKPVFMNLLNTCRHESMVRWSADWSQLIYLNGTTFVRDEDHDGGTCSIFRCGTCGEEFHVELPD